jgi:hypothetical protein
MNAGYISSHIVEGEGIYVIQPRMAPTVGTNTEMWPQTNSGALAQALMDMMEESRLSVPSHLQPFI